MLQRGLGTQPLHHEALRLRQSAQAQRGADDVAAREHAHQVPRLINDRQPADLRAEQCGRYQALRFEWLWRSPCKVWHCFHKCSLASHPSSGMWHSVHNISISPPLLRVYPTQHSMFTPCPISHPSEGLIP